VKGPRGVGTQPDHKRLSHAVASLAHWRRWHSSFALSCGPCSIGLNYHGSPNRNGIYVMPGLTWERARGIHLDTSFDGHIDGHTYTQPLSWQSPKTHRQLLLTATEQDVVYAL